MVAQNNKETREASPYCFGGAFGLIIRIRHRGIRLGIAPHSIDNWVRALPAGGPSRTLNQGSPAFGGLTTCARTKCDFYESKTAYESENMSRCRGTVDSIVTLILTHGYHSADYKMAMLEIGEKDKAIVEIAKSHKIKNVEPYLYTDKIQRDLYCRMGNAVIKEVLKKRRDELIKAKEIRHAKSRQKHHIDSLAYCLQKSADIAAEADREAIECFEEYRRKIEIAEIERKMKALEM